jgi:arabinogalactan endo-1,4-beta-galactosidase
MRARLKFISILLLFVVVSCSKEEETSKPLPLIKAADMSYLPLIESEGTIFYDNQMVAEDALRTLKESGCNTIRIRLWHSPADQHSGFNEVKLLAQRVKSLGMKVWLTVHYSDTWADPGQQLKPSAWDNLSFNQLKIQFEQYTAQIVTQIRPDIFQIGNEINNGFIFPEGNLSNNESQFLSLLASASNVIRAQSPSTKIMLHYAGIQGASWFFSKTTAIDYDYIGLSYYPVWHGTDLNLLQQTLTSLGQTYSKKVLIAETSYPFTLGWNDWTNNVLGQTNQLHPNYPATLDGQKNFLEQIKTTIQQTPNGVGFCYWGAEWIAFRGTQASNGSSWENQALWDFNHKSVPAMTIFK